MAPRRFGSIPGLSLQEALKAEDDKMAARGEAYRQRAHNFGSGGEADSVAPGVAPHPMMSLGSRTSVGSGAKDSAVDVVGSIATRDNHLLYHHLARACLPCCPWGLRQLLVLLFSRRLEGRQYDLQYLLLLLLRVLR